MGFLDDQLRQALEGNFGRRLDAAAKSTDGLKATIDKAMNTAERGVNALEAITPLLRDVVTELRKRP